VLSCTPSISGSASSLALEPNTASSIIGPQHREQQTNRQ